MPLDAVCIHALAAELQERIAEGRIDKVQQPERDLLLLSLRAKGENLRLLLAAGTGNARVHVTRAGFENPPEAPMFCMLLRKHLVGARITAVTRPQRKRYSGGGGRPHHRLYAPGGVRRGRPAPSAARELLPHAPRPGEAPLL